MRVYRYLSETKVEMLFGQMSDGVIDRTGAELGFQLPGFSVKVSAKPQEVPGNLFRKCEMVIQHIRDQKLASPVTQEAAFIEAVMPMRSGILQGGPDPLAFFGGVHDGTMVALVGSGSSVIGNGNEVAEGVHSIDYYGIKFLERWAAHAGKDLLQRSLDKRQHEISGHVDAIQTAITMIPTAWAELDFIALPIFRAERLVIASPIFVASAAFEYKENDGVISRLSRSARKKLLGG